MSTEADNARRLKQVPHLFVRGTNYEIGFSIGRTFKGLIEDFFSQYTDYEKVIVPAYESTEGKNVYNILLNVCQERYPNYVQELQGMADGAKLPFHQLFLLHIDGFIVPDDDPNDGNQCQPSNDEGSKGCTSIMTNGKDIFLGHTEDALREMMNNYYIISAEVTSEDGQTVLEKFSTLTYPGNLAGGTMGYNHHGLVHSINYIFPQQKFPTRTPHLFIMRALLGAKDLSQVIDILRDSGTGTGDGFNLNIVFAKGIRSDGGTPAVYSIEVSPNQNGGSKSELFVQEIERGESYAHCNKYLRCPSPQKIWYTSSSTGRHEIIDKFQKPYDGSVVQEILSQEVPDGEDKVKYSIFKRALNPDDLYATIAAGIFDLTAKQWNLYTHPPNYFPPVATIPINFTS